MSRKRKGGERKPADIPEILWFEEENDLIRSCAVLSSALGLQKSFSTSDISQLPSPEEAPPQPPPRCAISELALTSIQRSGYLLDHPRLEHASRYLLHMTRGLSHLPGTSSNDSRSFSSSRVPPSHDSRSFSSSRYLLQ
uniref:(California timema) hypothetical protein n=1 Tax=Timema californicum TaxID=61474 RepID=A0A7R9J321_TIMCA|nr:unnamed protein product [Timema californicum]